MKSKLLLQAALMLLLSFSFQFLFATGGGKIMGRVVDPDTKVPAADVTVVFDCMGNQLTCTTNDSGFYYSPNLPVGVYNVTAMFMSNSTTISGVKVTDDGQRALDLELSTAVQGGVVVILEDHIPIIDPINGDKVVVTRAEFTKDPVMKLIDITETQPGVVDINGVPYVHGAREGSLKYYVDGGAVMASADIPLCGLETYTMYSGFIPPKYGDTVGGVVVLETRNFFSSNH